MGSVSPPIPLEKWARSEICLFAWPRRGLWMDSPSPFPTAAWLLATRTSPDGAARRGVGLSGRNLIDFSEKYGSGRLRH